MKTCVRCLMTLPLKAFTPHRGFRDGLQSACKACETERMQMRKHGLTSIEKEVIAAAQGGCALCDRTEPDAKGWVVDHDHACCPGDASCDECRRAVLCQWCNSSLGYAGDSAELLRRMALYIELGTRLSTESVKRLSSRNPTNVTNERDVDVGPVDITSRLSQRARKTEELK